MAYPPAFFHKNLNDLRAAGQSFITNDSQAPPLPFPESREWNSYFRRAPGTVYASARRPGPEHETGFFIDDEQSDYLREYVLDQAHHSNTSTPSDLHKISFANPLPFPQGVSMVLCLDDDDKNGPIMLRHDESVSSRLGKERIELVIEWAGYPRSAAVISLKEDDEPVTRLKLAKIVAEHYCNYIELHSDDEHPMYLYYRSPKSERTAVGRLTFQQLYLVSLISKDRDIWEAEVNARIMAP